jgi:hypothetical protein
MPGIMELTDNGQSVGRIVSPEVRIRIVGGSELAERESGVPVLEAMPQKKEGSMPVELFGDFFLETWNRSGCCANGQTWPIR